MLLAALVGWLDQRQQEALEYLLEEHHIFGDWVHASRVSAVTGSCVRRQLFAY